MTSVFVGIDIAKASFVAALEDGPGESFSNDPEQFESLREWFEAQDLKLDQLHVCLETTGTYSLPLAAWLVEQGIQVSVVNPARVQGFAESELQRNKTDRSDARLIARFAAAHEPDEWTPEDEEWQKLKELTRRIVQLRQTRTQEQNRRQTPARSEACEASQEAHIEWLNEAIESCWEKIESLIADHETLQRPLEWVSSIPGLGRKASIFLIAEIRDIERFESAKKLAAYAGVTPERRESGQQQAPSSMSKRGSARMRHVLYMPALTAKCHNPIISEFCERLEQRGKDSMTVVGAAMHKLIRLVYGVWSNQTTFDPEYAA